MLDLLGYYPLKSEGTSVLVFDNGANCTAKEKSSSNFFSYHFEDQ